MRQSRVLRLRSCWCFEQRTLQLLHPRNPLVAVMSSNYICYNVISQLTQFNLNSGQILFLSELLSTRISFAQLKCTTEKLFKNERNNWCRTEKTNLYLSNYEWTLLSSLQEHVNRAKREYRTEALSYVNNSSWWD